MSEGDIDNIIIEALQTMLHHSKASRMHDIDTGSRKRKYCMGMKVAAEVRILDHRKCNRE